MSPSRPVALVGLGMCAFVLVWFSVATRSQSAGDSSVTTTTVSPSSTVPAFSPAWIETQEYLARPAAEVVDPVAARAQAERLRANPNDWLTPIGALCWAQHELERTSTMAFARAELDEWMAPALVHEYGLNEELLSDGLGPATSRRVLDALEALASHQATTTSVVPGSAGDVETEFVEWLRTVDYEGGEGTEWVAALDAVAGEEWLAAVRAGGRLPTDVLAYAEALAAAARDALAGTPTADDVPYGWGVAKEEYWAFVEMAKYDQNCRRAFLMERPPPLTFDIPDETVPGSEQSTTTTVRSGSVRVSGADLNGLMTPGEADLGVGYSRPAGVGSLGDTTFSHDGVGYEVERLLWWPNGTIRLDTYPDGLDTAVGDDGLLMITPVVDSSTEYVWSTADAEHLGGGADFVWDTEFVPNPGSLYRVELRIGVPDAPRNVGLSGTFVTWDAPSGGATVGAYYVWLRSVRPDGTGRSFYNVAAFEGEQQFEITYMVRFFGEELTVQVRSHNSAGYSPWTEVATFPTPTTTTTSTTAPAS